MKRLYLFALLLLTACAPPPTPAGPSAEEVEAQIGTSVALTVTAHARTQAAIASLTPIPSDTPTPTTALTPFPSLTPFPTSTPAPLGGGIPATVPAPYACSVVNKVPFDYAVFKRNEDFDIKLWLMNIGSREWGKGADLGYDSGTNMLTRATVYELPEVKSGQMVGPFIFDARTPRKPGTYTMTFKLQGGFCRPYIKIIVK